MKANITLVVLCLLPVFTMNAYAEPAIVIEGDLCQVLLIPPDTDPIFLTGDKVHGAIAVSGNDETPLAPTKVTCQGHHSVPFEFAIVHRDPCLLVDTPFGNLFTEDGKAVFTPSGNWTAQCTFKKATGPQN